MFNLIPALSPIQKIWLSSMGMAAAFSFGIFLVLFMH